MCEAYPSREPIKLGEKHGSPEVEDEEGRAQAFPEATEK